MLLLYIIETGNRFFGYRWMADDTIRSIKKWEDSKQTFLSISENYVILVDNFVARGLLKPVEYTSYNNVRKYEMPMQVYDELIELSGKQNSAINKVIASI